MLGTIIQFPSVTHPVYDIPKGWRIAKINGVFQDVAPSKFDISKLKFRSFLESCEKFIGGMIVRERAIELGGNLGFADGMRMRAEQDKIPVEELGDFYIVLPGTVLEGSDGVLYVSYLRCYCGNWYPGFHRLDGSWNDDVRFACR